MKIYPVKELFDGKIALSPCPQGHEKLASEIQTLKNANYKLVISMLTPEEQVKHGLTREQAICTAQGITYLNFPIRDEIADSDSETMRFIQLVSSELQQTLSDENTKVLFHCRGGVGRSSMLIALVMAQFGYDVEQVFQWITLARGETAPESNAQLEWVKKLTDN